MVGRCPGPDLIERKHRERLGDQRAKALFREASRVQCRLEHDSHFGPAPNCIELLDTANADCLLRVCIDHGENQPLHGMTARRS